MSIKDDNADGA